MVSGFCLVLAALLLLTTTGLRLAFATAGFAVELLGLGLLTQGYRVAQAGAR